MVGWAGCQFQQGDRSTRSGERVKPKHPAGPAMTLGNVREALYFLRLAGGRSREVWMTKPQRQAIIVVALCMLGAFLLIYDSGHTAGSHIEYMKPNHPGPMTLALFRRHAVYGLQQHQPETF